MERHHRTHLHPQIHLSEESSGMTRRRRAISAKALTSPLDDDDLLSEILLHLPPQPSSLPRASAVCKQWRCAATDPRFLRRFCIHHRKPPLLGVFEYRGNIVFTPILDTPDRIPPERFDLRIPCPGELGDLLWVHGDYAVLAIGVDYKVLGCRHGRVLVKDWGRKEVVICNPITSMQHHVSLPLEFDTPCLNGAVLCAADDQGHVHGACHSSHFKVVLVIMYRDDHRPIACVYSSETRLWGNIISTPTPLKLIDACRPGSLVGHALYWLSTSGSILEFDLNGNNLAVIEGLPTTNDLDNVSLQIIKVVDDVVGLAVLSYPLVKMWKRDINGHGIGTWVLRNTVELHNILGLSPQIEGDMRGLETILGYSEDTDEIFIYVDTNVYMVQLKSMKSKKLYETKYIVDYHPFTSFYSPGMATASECNEAELLHNT